LKNFLNKKNFLFLQENILLTVFLFSAFLLAALLPGCVFFKEKAFENGFLSVVVSVNNGSSIVSKTVLVKNGSTAFDVFNSSFNLSFTVHPVYGIYVTGINGLMEDSKAGKYWQYYVDGELAPVGVSSLVLTRNASLEFRFEAPAFNLNSS